MSEPENPDSLPKLKASIVNLKRFAQDNNKEWSCFNASIGKSPKNKYLIAFRSSNYIILPHGELHVNGGGSIKNQIWVADTNEKFQINNFRQIEMPHNFISTSRGIEDPRLFWKGNTWHIAGVMMESHTPVARFCVCKLDQKATKITDVQVYDGIKPNQPEKNWLAPDYKPNPNFDFIYGPNAIVKGNKVIYTMSNNKEIIGLRGNSHLIEQEDGTYLALMHRLWVKKARGYSQNNFGMVDHVIKNYGHYFVRFDRFGSIVEMSKGFQFIASGIEFVGGMIEMNKDIVISFGREDVSSHLAVLPKEDVIRMLKPISE